MSVVKRRLTQKKTTILKAKCSSTLSNFVKLVNE